MKNLNILGLLFQNFYLNELINQKAILRNKEMLKIVKKTEESHKQISMLSFPPGDEDVCGNSRLLSIWYKNARYDNLHQLHPHIASVEKYDDNTLILGDSYKLAIHFYDLRTHKVTKVLGAIVEGSIKRSHDLREDETVKAFSDGKINNIIIIDRNTVAGIHINWRTIIVWNVQKGEVVKVITEQLTLLLSTGENGEVYYIPTRGTIRCLNLKDNINNDYRMQGSYSNNINEMYYLNSKYLIFHYSLKRDNKILLCELLDGTYTVVKEIEGKITLKPLLINDNEFIYVGGENHILSYNFMEGKKTLPFKLDKDDYNEDRDCYATSYMRYKDADLLSTHDVCEIRIWDILTRSLKRIISSPLPCRVIITRNDGSFITKFNRDERHSYLQIWKERELELYPVLNSSYLIYDFVILNKHIVAILTEKGIEIWNIYTMKLVRHFPQDEFYQLTHIEKINSSVFACYYYFEALGDILSLYDYRKDESILEIHKGYDSDMLANLDGRYIAYLTDPFKLCVYDTRSLKEEKIIEISIADEDCYPESLAVVSRERVALSEDRGIIYIINWKKGVVEYSIDYTKKCGLKYCKLHYLDEDLLLLRVKKSYVVLNAANSSITNIVVKEEGLLFSYLTDYKKYLYRGKRMKLINDWEYKLVVSNELLAIMHQTRVIKC
jgi:hypothetical protein